MAKTKAITYNQNKPLQLAVDTINDRFVEMQDLLREKGFSAEFEFLKCFRQQCLTICYVIMVQAIKNPQDGKQYSFEQICLATPGIVGTTLHSVLESISMLGVDNSDEIMVENADMLLEETLLPEVMNMFHVPIATFYSSLIWVRNVHQQFFNKELVEHAKNIFLTTEQASNMARWEFLYRMVIEDYTFTETAQ